MAPWSARKTSGFLAVSVGRLPAAKCHTETRCGNDRQLAGFAISFLVEPHQQPGRGMDLSRSPRPAGWVCCRRDPSHRSCAGMHDLASVSTTVRLFSNSLRQTPASVSVNVRRQLPLIARRAVHHCAPLQIVQFGRVGRRLARRLHRSPTINYAIDSPNCMLFHVSNRTSSDLWRLRPSAGSVATYSDRSGE